MAVKLSVKGVSSDLTRATGGSAIVSLGEYSLEDLQGFLADFRQLVPPPSWPEDGLCPPHVFLDGAAEKMTLIADEGKLFWEERDLEISPAEVVNGFSSGEWHNTVVESISEQAPAEEIAVVRPRSDFPGPYVRKPAKKSFKYGIGDLIRLIFALLGGAAAFSPMVFLTPFIQESAKGNVELALIMIGAFFLSGAIVVFMLILAPTLNK
ncbi:MAG: hypothetical protein KKB51_04605 [Candidatus Riflebacteria bacterium]|nr:hypothetical protein [Candidatus Riflebacteria bacterium]